MFRQSQPEQTSYQSIVDGLKTLYKKKIRPLEEAYKFDVFHSACLTVLSIHLVILVFDNVNF